MATGISVPDQPSSPASLGQEISSTKNPMFDHVGMQTGEPILKEPGKTGSSSTDAETLLMALQNVIIPFVRPADGEYKHANQNVLGPDGEEFITALQKFILSFLRSQQGPVGGIEVELKGKGANIPNAASSARDAPHDEPNPKDVAMLPDPEPLLEKSSPKGNTRIEENLESIKSMFKAESVPNAGSPASSPAYGDHNPIGVTNLPVNTELQPSTIVPESERNHDPESIELIDERPTVLDSCSPVRSDFGNTGPADVESTDIFDSEQRRSQFVERLLKALQGHIFNEMPIRLLYFKLHASKLQITLIERSEIYAYIAPNLEASIDFSDVSREIKKFLKFDILSEREAEEYAMAPLIRKYSRYAILSHTWLRGSSAEVTYDDWNRGEFDVQQPGYQKLVNFCKAAWEDHGVAFGWMDTVCIKKESSAELDESIRSMYKWYSRADVCVTYLAETLTLSDMSNDAWFTRGWTLQELIAPFRIKFYDAYWNKVAESMENDKEDSSIQKQIELATAITPDELTRPIIWLPISRRMQMAANRQVTREEDSAYSLMGIFNVSISIAYGEGSERAFSRLLQEILNLSNNAADIFNWAGPRVARISNLLPSTPQDYLHRTSLHELDVWRKPIEPLILTHIGLRVTIVLMRAISVQDPALRYNSFGDYHAIADISILTRHFSVPNMVGGSYSVLDARISQQDGWKKKQNWYQLTFGILNVGSDNNSTIIVPSRCLAIGLDYSGGNASKIPTKAPIVFVLNARWSSDGTRDFQPTEGVSYIIKRRDLASHGMKVVTLYL